MTPEMWNIFIGIITAVVSAAVVFYLKDMLEKKTQFQKLKKKLDRVAGLQAAVIYNGERLKITSIDEDGIVLESKSKRVFLPIMQVLQNEIILPTDEYERLTEEKEEKEFQKRKQQTLEMTDDLIDRMIPKMYNKLIGDLRNDKTEVSAVIGVKITSMLKDEGYEIKKIEDKSTGTKIVRRNQN